LFLIDLFTLPIVNFNSCYLIRLI